MPWYATRPKNRCLGLCGCLSGPRLPAGGYRQRPPDDSPYAVSLGRVIRDWQVLPGNFA